MASLAKQVAGHNAVLPPFSDSAILGVLIFPDFQLLDAAGPISVFEIAGRFVRQPVAIRLLAATAGAVRSSSCVEMMACDLRSAGAVTTLIVAGGEGVEAAARCGTTLAFVRRLAKRGVRIASVCSGAYVLAEAGLLTGRRATTHWCRTLDFGRRYPDVKLEPDRIFTRDGTVWTSAGITAGIDLALAIVAEDHGNEVAQDTARQLVIYHRRSGGQSQFSPLLELKASSGRFGALLRWTRENLDARITVEDLAERAGLSPRHFARAFTVETGSTPAKAIERLRIEVAQSRLQHSSESIEQVAQAAGFRNPERMRRAFVRASGQAPQSVRRAARSPALARYRRRSSRGAATPMTARMATGVMQPGGTMAIEPTMDVDNVGRTVLLIANMSLDANIQFVSVMASKMPFLGRN